MQRFLICYGDEVVFRLTSPDEAQYCIHKFKRLLKKFGLWLNIDNTRSYDLSISNVIRFDYLGYTFLINSGKNLYCDGLGNTS